MLNIVWRKSFSKGFVRYATRRLFRLAPLYFLVLLYCFFVGGISVFDLILRLFFLDAFIPNLFVRDPIGVLWTLSVEFWCSLLIPVLSNTLSSRFKYHWLLLYLLTSLIIPRILIASGINELMAWKSISSSLFCFAIGVYLSNVKKSDGGAEAFKVMGVLSIGFFGMYLAGGYIEAWWTSILLTVSFLDVVVVALKF